MVHSMVEKTALMWADSLVQQEGYAKGNLMADLMDEMADLRVLW